MKDEILLLRKEGKTYNEIRLILKCSKSTISYYCGDGQKEKSLNRCRKNRKKAIGALIHKLTRLKRKAHDNLRISSFLSDGSFTYSTRGRIQFLNKCISNPHCFWTGEPIDLTDTKSYELDHYIQYQKEGLIHIVISFFQKNIQIE